MASSPDPPRGVQVAAAFFGLGGILEIACAIYDAPRPLAFWPVWEALGRALLHFLLAAGLWHRLALCRSIALVYCLAMVATYAVALLLAWNGAAVRYPSSVVVQSLFQVPSCVLLFPYLRSPAAAATFTRALFTQLQ
jgi:hypothetical protein